MELKSARDCVHRQSYSVNVLRRCLVARTAVYICKISYKKDPQESMHRFPVNKDESTTGADASV